MAAAIIPIVASLVGGLAGGLGSRAGKQSQTPQYSQAQQGLLDSLLSGFSSNLGMATSGGLVNSLISSALKAITNKTNAATQLTNNLLTQRGLSRTTGGASMLFNPAYQGMSEKAQLIAQRPQLEFDLRNQALQNAGNFFNQLRTGQDQTQSGNVLGGIAGGAGSVLSTYLGDIWRQKNPYNTAAGIQTPGTQVGNLPWGSPNSNPYVMTAQSNPYNTDNWGYYKPTGTGQ